MNCYGFKFEQQPLYLTDDPLFNRRFRYSPFNIDESRWWRSPTLAADKQLWVQIWKTVPLFNRRFCNSPFNVQGEQLAAARREQVETSSSLGKKMMTDIQQEKERTNQRVAELQNRFVTTDIWSQDILYVIHCIGTPFFLMISLIIHIIQKLFTEKNTHLTIVKCRGRSISKTRVSDSDSDLCNL